MPSWWKVTSDAAERVEIDIYGDIGDDGWGNETSVSAKQFLDMVRDAKGKAIDLHVNSGGGSVFDAFAMMTALASHDAPVTAYVDGIAASAASFILAAADEVAMSTAAFIMIHDASTVAWGNAKEMRETAEWLDTIDNQLAGIYAKKGKRAQEDFKAAMDATTWFTADEALEWGIVDRTVEAVAAAACVTNDRAALDTAPEGANLGERPEPTDGNAEGGEPQGQEPQAEAQERVALIDGHIYVFTSEKEQ